MLPHPPGPIQPRDRSRNTLDSLCNMYGVTSFRPGQLECLQAFSEGKDVWAQLPCGGGKTLVFIMSLLLSNHNHKIYYGICNMIVYII